LRLEAIKVLLHIGMFKNIYNNPINYFHYVGRDGVLKLGETHVFNMLVDKLSSDPIQVANCCLHSLLLDFSVCVIVYVSGAKNGASVKRLTEIYIWLYSLKKE